MYFIPEDLLREFRKVSSDNCSNTGRHVETLAFLIGYKLDDDNLVGTDLIFPEQEATSSRVDDKGTVRYKSEKYIMNLLQVLLFH